MKMKSRCVVFLIMLLVFAGVGTVSSAGQTGPPPGLSGGINGTVTINRPDSLPDTGYFGFMANTQQGVASGAGLWGKVRIDGDPLLWEPIAIALSCVTGKTELTTVTGVDGRFGITRVNLPQVYTLAGDVRNQMEQHYEGCTVRAELAGYRSSTDTITEKVLRDKPFLDDITLTREENAPGTDISEVAGSSSAEAESWYQKAHDEWVHGNADGARKDLEQVVKIDPKRAEAWYLLGRLQAASDLKAATESLQQAQTLDPRFVPPCEWLALIAIQKRDWPTANSWASRALALHPSGSAWLWYENAVADYRMGKNEAARAAAEHAMAMDPEHNVQNAEEVLALTLINKGDYSAALDHLRNSLTYMTGSSADLIKRQIAFVEQKTGADRK